MDRIGLCILINGPNRRWISLACSIKFYSLRYIRLSDCHENE